MPEKNIIDHKMIEYALWETHKIPTIRLTLTEIHRAVSLHPQTNDLLIGNQVVLLVYFRAAYTPRDFPTQDEWDALLTIERSRAIKCPSIAYHLAGTKKMQQVLSLPGMIERFVTPEAALRLRKVICPMWGLENNDSMTEAIIAKAKSNTGNFVLKPQREGGGNNFWNEEINKELSRMTIGERPKYILMQKIKARVEKTAVMKEGSVRVIEGVTEYGLFSYFIGNGREELWNKVGGYLLRTKEATTTEGGVSSGHAFIDTPLLL